MAQKKTVRVIIRSGTGKRRPPRVVVVPRPKLTRAQKNRIRRIRRWEERSANVRHPVSGPVE